MGAPSPMQALAVVEAAGLLPDRVGKLHPYHYGVFFQLPE